MENGGIAIERKGRLALVTMRRPQRMNAFNQAMFAGLDRAARELAAAPSPRVVILTGAGDDAFCAGFDVNPDNPMVAQIARGLERGQRAPILRCIDDLRASVDRFVSLPMPVIAAVNGKAFGGGAELAVRCDLRVMDPAAQLCFSEVRLGLMPDWGGGATLAHLVGPSVAADLVLTARRIGAHEAAQLGLVNRISVPGKAVDAAIELAETILTHGPRAVRSALKVIRASCSLSLEDSLALEKNTAVDLIASGECLYGINAFLTGEAPDFPDPIPDAGASHRMTDPK